MRNLVRSCCRRTAGLLHAAANGATTTLQTLVVTATRIPTPQSQIASSITVITADDIAARQLADAARCAEGGPRSEPGANRRPGRPDLGVHARHEFESHQGAGRWHRRQRSEQSERGVRFRPVPGPGHPTRRNPARSAERPVRLRCHRRRHQRHHQERLRARRSSPASLEGGSFDTFNQAAASAAPLDRFHYAANVEHFHSGATPVTPLDAAAAGRAAHRRLRRQSDRLDQARASMSPIISIWGWSRATPTRTCASPATTSPRFPATARTRRRATTTRCSTTRAPPANCSRFDGALEQTARRRLQQRQVLARQSG